MSSYASYAKTYLKGLAQNPNQKIVLKTMTTVTIGAFLLSSGVLIINDQSSIESVDTTEKNSTTSANGYICCIVGIIIVASPIFLS